MADAVSTFWSTGDDRPRHSELFTAKYGGTCQAIDCYKRNIIEQGDCCQYFDNDLMHMRCARATERAEAS